jgi:hypothetical protein
VSATIPAFFDLGNTPRFSHRRKTLANSLAMYAEIPRKMWSRGCSTREFAVRRARNL